jgi:hypothetical protein
VIGDLVKRLFNGAVLFLAALTFFLVPVGTKTPAQHLVAIFSTKPAREAGSAFADAARRAAARAKEGIGEITRDSKKAPPDTKLNETVPLAPEIGAVPEMPPAPAATAAPEASATSPAPVVAAP